MNTETKRHIDAARQVLVGVVPNPTSQIDQITNALIYKFMDDMDQAAIKADGKASFFIDDLEPYAWTRLMDTRMGNQERMDLYSEALTKFSEAKQLPELFRNIFKSAFLPYRSPETLGLFLKEIAHFDYSHPEELGNAYEYLLSIMSSQGDAGQFRTPRHIIDFIVDVINPTKDDKILDPACGTGGFLVSSYKHITEQHDEKNDSEKKTRPLTPDERKKLMNNFEGYDIDPTMVRIAQVNTYLHQFKNPKIYNYDTLSNDERWNDKFDVILANPPFMSPKGGITPHSKFSIQASRSEVLFVDYIMNHLKPKGRAGIIVPEGIIFQSGSAYKQLRKNLVENSLYAVVSLPSGVFQPYSGVKTSILIFNNELAKQSTEILFVKVENDGFDLGAQRRQATQNDLPQALNILNKWKTGEKTDNKLAIYVEKSKIAESNDYNLSGDRYRLATNYTNTKWPMVKIGKSFQIEAGGTPSSKEPDYWDGEIKWATLVDVPATIKTIFDTQRKITPKGLKDSSAKLLPKGTVLVSSRATIGRIAIAGCEMATNQGFKNVIVDKNNNSTFVAYALSEKVEEMVSLSQGGTFKEISKSNFSNIEIPLPPLEIQEQIVAELDGYASIIAGARKVVENWKPKIDIDPMWEKVKLGDVCEVKGGKRIPKGNTFSSDTSEYPYIRVVDFKNGSIDLKNLKYISKEIFEKIKRYTISANDVYISIAGTIGLIGTIPPVLNEKSLTENAAKLVIKNQDTLSNQFLATILLSNDSQDQISKLTQGVGVPKLSLARICTIEIPLPPLDIQKQIVEKIESERALVESTKKLIAIYEQKTKEAVSKLWNE